MQRVLTLFFAAALAVSSVETATLYSSLKTAENSLEEMRGKVRSLQAECAGLQARVRSLQSEDRSHGIHRRHFQAVVQAVLVHLGIPSNERADWTRLLMLTVATESDGGRFLRQLKGPARGVMQAEPASERHALDWLKARKPAVYERVRSLRNKAKLTGVSEIEYNLAYAIAVAYGEYVCKGASPVGLALPALARLYKRHYNTPLGKATINGAMLKATLYGVE